MKSIFKCSNQPVNITDQCIKKLLDTLYVLNSSTNKCIVYCSSIFRKVLYEFENTSVKTVSKTLPQCNIEVIFQYKNRLSNLFKFKDFIPFHLRSHLIYKFPCSNCNITYHSETESQVEVGAGRHTRGRSKMTSPQKCQILEPPPPMSSWVTFLSSSSPQCQHANSDKLFSWSKTLKNNFTFFVQLICNWDELNRPTNETTT